MPFELVWQPAARAAYDQLVDQVRRGRRRRGSAGKTSAVEGLLKQVQKCLQLLSANPRHPGLQTHSFHSLPHPYDRREKVFEAYAQNRTPGAYRVFWCYGPGKARITILAITPHP